MAGRDAGLHPPASAPLSLPSPVGAARCWACSCLPWNQDSVCLEIPAPGGGRTPSIPLGASHADPEDSRDAGALFPFARAWVASQGCVFIWQEPFPLFGVWDVVGSGLQQGSRCCRVQGSGRALRSVCLGGGPAASRSLPEPGQSLLLGLCFHF